MSEYQAMLKGERWKETRARINSYGAGRCEACGCKTSSPQVHHTKYEGYHPSDTSDEYLMSLCPECHYEAHWIQRLRAYSAEKRKLYESNIEITPELHEKLKEKHRV